MNRQEMKRFDLEDQRGFARLSGDFNPMHVDPERARRELFGEVVVHGIHVLLASLDSLLAQYPPAARMRIQEVECRFQNPVLLGGEIQPNIVEREGDSICFEARDVEGVLHLDARIVLTNAGAESASVDGARYEPAEPRDLGFVDLEGLSGHFEPGFDAAEFAARFATLSRFLDPVDLADVLSLTRLVGMECPGLQSIFAGFRLQRRSGKASVSRFDWKVRECNERFSMVKLDVVGAHFEGAIETFLRPRVETQPSIESVVARIPSGAFTDQRVLVVGGNRGIGEVTAKVIAAGGGRPIVTYRSGGHDAARLQDEIVSAGLSCEIASADVLEGPGAIDAAHLAALHSLYFYASPRILKQSGTFRRALFDDFSGFYVEAFHDWVKRAAESADEGLRVFYPSSTMVEDHDAGFVEYAAAKRAGEGVCGTMNRHWKNVKVHVERLPKLATDQTLSLIRSRRMPVLEAIQPVVETVQSIKF